MRSLVTILAAIVLLTFPTSARAQGSGYFEWSVSRDLSDPFMNTGPDAGGIGVQTYYLWYVEGCFSPPGDPLMEGMSAADIGLYALGDWSIVAFSPQNGFLNAGDSTKLLLAVGSCPTGPLVAGNILIQGNVGGIRLGVGQRPSTTGTVDCTIDPDVWTWPQYVRFVGFRTNGSLATLQDEGNGCTADPVDETSWGSIKSLYHE
jgi:hypothetical protein